MYCMATPVADYIVADVPNTLRSLCITSLVYHASPSEHDMQHYLHAHSKLTCITQLAMLSCVTLIATPGPPLVLRPVP
jgi:hypothetical protein